MIISHSFLFRLSPTDVGSARTKLASTVKVNQGEEQLRQTVFVENAYKICAFFLMRWLSLLKTNWLSMTILKRYFAPKDTKWLQNGTLDWFPGECVSRAKNDRWRSHVEWTASSRSHREPHFTTCHRHKSRSLVRAFQGGTAQQQTCSDVTPSWETLTSPPSAEEALPQQCMEEGEDKINYLKMTFSQKK